jgi:hypothetical protein
MCKGSGQIAKDAIVMVVARYLKLQDNPGYSPIRGQMAQIAERLECGLPFMNGGRNRIRNNKAYRGPDAYERFEWLRWKGNK